MAKNDNDPSLNDNLNGQDVNPHVRRVILDPRLHLRLFLEVCDSFRQQGVPEDALRLKLFPYSLRDYVRAWLNALPLGTVESLNDLCQRFFARYNPPNMNAKLRNDITSFWKLEDETLYKAWERSKDLIQKFLMHGFQHKTQMKIFYNGLNAYTRMVVDASANGTFLDKSYNEAFEILEMIVNNDYQYLIARLRTGKKVSGTMELDAITSLTTQVSSLTNMTKTMKRPTAIQEMKAVELECVYYGEYHVFDECPSNLAFVCYMANFNWNNNPYSNTYNPRSKQHPNFGWNNHGTGNFNNAVRQNAISAPPGYNQPMSRQNVQQGQASSSIEDLLKEYMAKNDVVIQIQAASL
ncbi:uncharacterized protein LOC108478088 [Gossypium arboreum]|uniref:uncharacterized protein LOC108478088 n=1 Tax=Gossypium arboreum TaxID=29729 RepID=UPI0008193FEC|nr:uncharacterized protein LOC108478088 [Gossypium arboreum]